jgi:hypothetical protein
MAETGWIDHPYGIVFVFNTANWFRTGPFLSPPKIIILSSDAIKSKYLISSC